MSRTVYADNAATTEIYDEVLEAMLPYLKESYGNPSSLHKLGQKARAAVDAARKEIAGCLGCSETEIYFTSGGSESDNWALRGAAAEMKKRGRTHIISSAIEHHAVLNTLKELEKDGFTVTLLPVDRDGIVSVNELKAAARDETGLVSIMWANNEIGSIQPIDEIGAFCRERSILFHTDAVAAAGYEKIDLQRVKADLLSISGHKLHAPKGVGLLYIRSGVGIDGMISGGAQERGLRAGTENVAGIAGFAKAMKLAAESLDERRDKIAAMRDRLTEGLLKIPGCTLNGGRISRSVGNANFRFEGISGESLLILLDMHGICASAGSACMSGSLEASHVLKALGLSEKEALSCVRFSLGDLNCEEDVDYILSVVPGLVQRLRDLKA